MKKNRNRLALLLASCLLLIQPCLAGTADFEFLNQEFGARGAGLGGAFTALANDSSACYWNPAGLASLKRSDLCLTHSELPQSSRLEGMFLALPMGWLGSYGFGFFYRSYGEFERRDEYGALLPDKMRPRSLAFSLGYGKDIMRKLSLGAGIKVASEKLAFKNRTFFGGDFGLLTRPFHLVGVGRPLSLLKLGVSARNLGTGNSDYPMPMLLSVGLSYQLGLGKTAYLFPTADYRWQEDFPGNYRLGAELYIRPHLFLRGGYAMDEGGEGGMTGGVGISYHSMRLDYAYHDYGIFGASHLASVSLRFKKLSPPKPGGKKEKRRRVKKRRPAK